MRRASAVYFLLTFIVVSAILASRRPAAVRAAPKATANVDLDDLVLSPEMSSLFQQFNEKYFRGRLPATPVFWSRRLLDSEDMMGLTMSPAHGRFVILLDRKMIDDGFDSTAISTLLHEECHTATFGEKEQHGPRFEACMERLAARGAFRAYW